MTSGSEVTIACRLATSEDLDFIYQSLQNIAKEDGYIDHFFLTIDKLKEALFSEKSFSECLIAELNRKPIAIMLFSEIHLNFNRFNKPGLYVHDLYVSKECRRLGIANKLGSAIIQTGKDRGCDRIDGIIPKTNFAATAFYQTIEDIKVLDYIHYMRLNLK